jgi:hypothetical protein
MPASSVAELQITVAFFLTRSIELVHQVSRLRDSQVVLTVSSSKHRMRESVMRG